MVKLAHVHRKHFDVSLDADEPPGVSSPTGRLRFCITGSLQAPTRSPKMRESTEAGRRRTNTPGNSEWWSAWSSPLYCPCSALSSSSESVSGRFIQKKTPLTYIFFSSIININIYYYCLKLLCSVFEYVARFCVCLFVFFLNFHFFKNKKSDWPLPLHHRVPCGLLHHHHDCTLHMCHLHQRGSRCRRCLLYPFHPSHWDPLWS